MKTTFCNKHIALNGMKLAKITGLFLLGMALTSCSEQKDTPPAAAATGEEKIVIKGSNTVGEELAPRLIAEYRKEHPKATFEMESKATGYGLANLAAGMCDIAGASREAIKEELEEAHSRNIELNNYIIGSYSVAVVLNAANPVGNLTREQVRDIFTGAVQNWKDVGGPDSAIHLYVRDPISGTYLGFKELALENKAYGENPHLLTNYAAIVQAVAQDPGGIGYSAIDLGKQTGAKAVSIGGVPPTVETVNAGKYPYVRTLRLYTNKAKEAAPTLDFIKFVKSARGQEIVGQTGFVPHP
jgi:phosphate transport system substrate-binding protein